MDQPEQVKLLQLMEHQKTKGWFQELYEICLIKLSNDKKQQIHCKSNWVVPSLNFTMNEYLICLVGIQKDLHMDWK